MRICKLNRRAVRSRSLIKKLANTAGELVVNLDEDGCIWHRLVGLT